MANVNKVFLIGNLTAEPEIRQLPSGDTIASFSLAMNRRYTVAQYMERAEKLKAFPGFAGGQTR